MRAAASLGMSNRRARSGAPYQAPTSGTGWWRKARSGRRNEQKFRSSNGLSRGRNPFRPTRTPSDRRQDQFGATQTGSDGGKSLFGLSRTSSDGGKNLSGRTQTGSGGRRRVIGEGKRGSFRGNFPSNTGEKEQTTGEEVDNSGRQWNHTRVSEIPLCRSEFLQDFCIEIGRRVQRGEFPSTPSMEAETREQEGEKLECLWTWVRTYYMTRVTMMLLENMTARIWVELCRRRTTADTGCPFLQTAESSPRPNWSEHSGIVGACPPGFVMRSHHFHFFARFGLTKARWKRMVF